LLIPNDVKYWLTKLQLLIINLTERFLRIYWLISLLKYRIKFQIIKRKNDSETRQLYHYQINWLRLLFKVSSHLLNLLRVVLAQDDETGDKYAIKIIKGDFNQNERLKELIRSEVSNMKKLAHGNLVNLIDYKENGTLTKENGRIETITYIVLELATGGELFDYVSMTG
jgi:serine/threonine protein kinase